VKEDHRVPLPGLEEGELADVAKADAGGIGGAGRGHQQPDAEVEVAPDAQLPRLEGLEAGARLLDDPLPGRGPRLEA